MLNRLYLWFINYLLDPYHLEYISSVASVQFIIVNEARTDYRLLGSRNWLKWVAIPDIYEEIHLATPSNISFDVLKEFLRKDLLKKS